MNYVEYVVCKDFRLHGRASHTVSKKLHISKKSSFRALQAADLKARLISLHLAIEDRYATLEREGNVQGFEMCMRYQDKIYLLVCPEDPEPNADIRRPLLTALTLAHYVQCEELSILHEMDLLSRTTTEYSDSVCTYKKYQYITSEQIKINLRKLYDQLFDRYNILSAGRDIMGCTIVLQYQDKIKNLLFSSGE